MEEGNIMNPRAVSPKAIIEAILFTMGDSISIDKLAEVIEESHAETIQILDEMAEDYNNSPERGISLIRLEDNVQLCTKPAMYEYLVKIAKSPQKLHLTDTIMETLSIIAYKQPITKAEIERIRGVSCEHAVNKLLEYDLITELGRMDAPGRPLLFGTTEQFLRSFGVENVKDLPELDPIQLEELKTQVKEESELNYENSDEN